MNMKLKRFRKNFCGKLFFRGVAICLKILFNKIDQLL